MTEKSTKTPRPPLSRDLVLRAGIDLADREGLDAVTMRRLGTELGYEAMSLYKHVANKEEILLGMVEEVIGEIEIPLEGSDWREAMRRRAMSARAVLARHPWAIGLMEAGPRTGPVTLRYLNAILGNLRAAGFSFEQAAHAFWLLDGYVYGQVVQESSLPFSTSQEMTENAAAALDQSTMDDYPHLVAMYEHAQTFSYSIDGEFEFGLELILDGLERHRDQSAKVT